MDVNESFESNEQDLQEISGTEAQEIQPTDKKDSLEQTKIEAKDLSPDGNINNIEDEINSSNFKFDELDKKLHEEILEKLDIQKRQDSQDQNAQENFIQKVRGLEILQAKDQLEKTLSQDLAKIQKLVKEGLINPKQGQNFKKQVLQKAFDKLVQMEKVKRALPTVSNKKEQLTGQSKNGFDEFNKTNPDFFTSDGRKEVLDYLKSGGTNFGKEELNKISSVIRLVEKAAIERYLQKASYEKTLKNSNESAKQRLTANAQKSNFSGNGSRIFTREQIGKMSSSEFAKYEAAIMEQLKKGHIR